MAQFLKNLEHLIKNRTIDHAIFLGLNNSMNKIKKIYFT